MREREREQREAGGEQRESSEREREREAEAHKHRAEEEAEEDERERARREGREDGGGKRAAGCQFSAPSHRSGACRESRAEREDVWTHVWRGTREPSLWKRRPRPGPSRDGDLYYVALSVRGRVLFC